MTVTPDAVEAAARADYLPLAPTTNDLRDLWADMRCRNTEQVPLAYAEFDRWLAEHDAQVAKQTLLDAARALPMDCYDPRHMAEFLTARAATLTPKEN